MSMIPKKMNNYIGFEENDELERLRKEVEELKREKEQFINTYKKESEQETKKKCLDKICKTMGDFMYRLNTCEKSARRYGSQAMCPTLKDMRKREEMVYSSLFKYYKDLLVSNFEEEDGVLERCELICNKKKRKNDMSVERNKEKRRKVTKREIESDEDEDEE